MRKTGHPHYYRWRNMMNRCYRNWHPKFADYGGRGVTVAPEWHDFNAFAAYLETLGPCPDGCSIDRKDNDKGYEPGNIRWATSTEQNTNKRLYRVRTKPNKPYAPRKGPMPTSKTIVMDGARALTQTEAASILGCRPDTLRDRLRLMRSKQAGLTHVDIKSLRK